MIYQEQQKRTDEPIVIMHQARDVGSQCEIQGRAPGSHVHRYFGLNKEKKIKERIKLAEQAIQPPSHPRVNSRSGSAIDSITGNSICSAVQTLITVFLVKHFRVLIQKTRSKFSLCLFYLRTERFFLPFCYFF